MEINQYQQWVTKFYKERDWYDYHPFIRVNFLSEEIGEIARAVRAIEIGRDRPDEETKSKKALLADLQEEIGDVLDSLFILANKYDITLDDIMKAHQEKLLKRFN